jgi:hypothetical protein
MVREKRKPDQGAANVLLIILLVVLAIGAYAGIQLFPLYWDHWNFEKTAETQMVATLASARENLEATVKQQIVQLLDAMGAQYQPEHVRTTLSSDQKSMQAEVWYARPHHLPLYPNPKRFYLKLEHELLLPKLNLPQPTPLPAID